MKKRKAYASHETSDLLCRTRVRSRNFDDLFFFFPIACALLIDNRKKLWKIIVFWNIIMRTLSIFPYKDMASLFWIICQFQPCLWMNEFWDSQMFDLIKRVSDWSQNKIRKKKRKRNTYKIHRSVFILTKNIIF